MKTILQNSILGVAAMFLFAVSANAQAPTVTNVGVTAMLADQLSVTKTSDVHFGGIFIPADADATASMDYQGHVTITNGTTSLYSTNLQKQGGLTISANKTTSFTIEYPATANLTNGNNTIVYTPKLYSLVGVAIPSSSTTTYSLDTNESGDGSSYSKVVNIGGDLVVPFKGYAGTYLGNIDVTVTWK